MLKVDASVVAGFIVGESESVAGKEVVVSFEVIMEIMRCVVAPIVDIECVAFGGNEVAGFIVGESKSVAGERK